MASSQPESGSVWGGGGMTVRVLEVLDDDVRVLVLTGRGRVLKRPHQTGVIRLSAFGTSMKPTTIPEVMKPKTA